MLLTLTNDLTEVHLCRWTEPCACRDPGAQRAERTFLTASDAEGWLRRLGVDDAAMRRLRRLADDETATPSAIRLSDDTVIAQVAALLARGRLRALECRTPRVFAEIEPLAGASAPETPSAPPRAPDVELTWIEIQLLDPDDNPIPGEAYEVMTPDTRVHTGRLDENGRAYIDRIPAGECRIRFPRIDGREWRPA